MWGWFSGKKVAEAPAPLPPPPSAAEADAAPPPPPSVPPSPPPPVPEGRLLTPAELEAELAPFRAADGADRAVPAPTVVDAPPPPPPVTPTNRLGGLLDGFTHGAPRGSSCPPGPLPPRSSYVSGGIVEGASQHFPPRTVRLSEVSVLKEPMFRTMEVCVARAEELSPDPPHEVRCVAAQPITWASPDVAATTDLMDRVPPPLPQDVHASASDALADARSVDDLQSTWSHFRALQNPRLQHEGIVFHAVPKWRFMMVGGTTRTMGIDGLLGLQSHLKCLWAADDQGVPLDLAFVCTTIRRRRNFTVTLHLEDTATVDARRLLDMTKMCEEIGRVRTGVGVFMPPVRSAEDSQVAEGARDPSNYEL